ncbi:uncharacterized protein L3040_004087 [Drepanopeziza brunnea f. sp. 'multigermtubi']|uniref:Fumarylacetoacetate hydrolase n=1 Tax=Marssonina brunnea f. sp. multigermtubi (strain MB_m1) TaxID=1072389 RepID=K1XDC7_MARBU|nr:fumarylacetoacetate hydrolase [Drepanopeziza brunnea f. sp. 'multigermtubi' MB_m1]EKD18863.1 fumarylacetoacetate hydrolase [Drepanopeziza brunnea f. sp. 'multigermtubi' MB_m1]KAJ5042688.1 hypothetical protein L3040_004087 [Drepanopeziza brunnea f. sp. 'multigermtubi']
MAPWTHLVHLVAEEDGQPYYARCTATTVPQVGEKVETFESVAALEAAAADGTTTPDRHVVRELLPPAAANVPIICIGLNYANHAQEASLEIPQSPPMWYKPPSALTGPGPIPIPPSAQTHFLDYEGELTIITGARPAKDLSVADAAAYILGYAVGNDLTARYWQAPSLQAGQFTYAKAFDAFAPLGVVVAHPDVLGLGVGVGVASRSNSSSIKEGSKEGSEREGEGEGNGEGASNGEGLKPPRISTRVNGKLVQASALDLLRGPAELLSFLSQGRTVPAGTAIMTGTPAGVGWFQRPRSSLRDGDVVEVAIEGVGSLRNVMVFE